MVLVVQEPGLSESADNRPLVVAAVRYLTHATASELLSISVRCAVTTLVPMVQYSLADVELQTEWCSLFGRLCSNTLGCFEVVQAGLLPIVMSRYGPNLI